MPVIDWLEEALNGAQPHEEHSSLAEALKRSAGVLSRPAVRENGAEGTPEESGQGDGLSLNRGEVGQTLPSALRKWAEELDGAVGRNGLPGGQASGVERLYRRMAEAVAVSPISAAVPGVVREEQTAETAGLTVRELDRAVRRDSRRYDGGMNIY